jgi:hypothetical protein
MVANTHPASVSAGRLVNPIVLCARPVLGDFDATSTWELAWFCRSGHRAPGQLRLRVVFGATGCTYEAKRAVADLAEDRRTGTLVGAGEIVETCGQSKRTFDVLKPTSARVTGPSKVAVGAHHDEPFHIVLLADNRELTYANAVNWTLGHDCAGKAVIQKNPGAQDTGRDEKNLWLETKGKGQCTVIGDVLGQQAEKLVSIE